jgi:hypothetical protein
MQARVVVAIVMVALFSAVPFAAAAQWRATAWTMDLHNDTNACLNVTAEQFGDGKVIDEATVWAGRWQHFDDNHTTLVIHARVYEKLDCTGKFIADLHDGVQQIRNILTVVKNGDTFALRREAHW